VTLITDLIAELYRAANEIDRLTTVEKRRLLETAGHTMRDMDQELGNVGDHRSERNAGELLKPADTMADGVPDILDVHRMLVRTPLDE
jgi:hypothetical protein